MTKPIIFSIDDDPQVLRAISRDLKSQYNTDYKIISTTSANEALEALTEMKNSGDAVAMFLVDQRMPEMEGVDFLDKAIKIYPDAKRVLLTAYSDTVAAIKAINVVQLDYYLTKPWNPPEEKLYPVINDLLDDWQSHYTPDFKGIKLVGYQYNPKSHEIKDYLAGNLIPYRWFDIENNPLIKYARKHFKISTELDGQKFTTIKNGKRFLTPPFLVLIMIESTDIIFAVDSMPAILQEPVTVPS